MATGEAGIKVATGIAIGEAGIARTVIATVAAGIENDRRVAVETEIVVISRRSETSHVRGTEIGVDPSLEKKIEVETGIEIEIETVIEIRIRKANLETVARTRTGVGPEIKTSAKISLEAAIKVVMRRKRKAKIAARVEVPAKARTRMTKIAAVVAMTRRKMLNTKSLKGQMRKTLVALTLAPERRLISNRSQSRAAVLWNKLVPSPL